VQKKGAADDDDAALGMDVDTPGPLAP